MVLHPTTPKAPVLPDAAALASIAERAWALRPLGSHEGRDVLRGEAGILIDGLLTRVARGHGALDVALGEALAALAEGDRVLRLGFSSIRDYARERLGIGGTVAQGLIRLARELWDRPLLAGAVRSGEISVRQAQTVLPVARGDDERGWLERARTSTVRQLEKAVREATVHPERSGAEGESPGESEPWERVELMLSAEGHAVLDEALALAGKILGATAPVWDRLEVICQEYLGAHPAPKPEPGAKRPEDEIFLGRLSRWREEWKDALEGETRWAFLQAVETYAAPPAPPSTDPHALDAELRHVAAARDRWDEVLGHLAMLMRGLGLWRDARFATFEHDCAQRLGLSQRTVEQRIWLERRLYELPELRVAMREGRVSYEKARIVAGAATEKTLPCWLARAEEATCIELRREAQAEEKTQMCERGELRVRVPGRMVQLLADLVAAARAAKGRWMPAGDCLETAAHHFIDTWKEALKERNTLQKRVLERDGGLCQVPGCSRAAVHVHHVRYRSRGGTDCAANLVSLCAVHHLHGIHRGFIRVKGEAPGGLVWIFPALAGRGAMA
jgi:hypothetical protein